MNAEVLTDRATDTGDQTNLCVVLRPSDGGLQALLVADEKGRWSIPGGHAKDDESHAEACVREVKEETGLDVEVQPLMWADHAARKIPSNVFYAVVAPDTEGIRPGGGDVTKVRWAAVRDLGELNGTDRLVIQVAANRIHNPQALVDDAVEMAESLNYAVGNVAAPPPTIEGVYVKLIGSAGRAYAQRLVEMTDVVVILAYNLYESTYSALEWARTRRKLTPMIESLLRVSDALWRYEQAVAPRLAEGRPVLEIGQDFNREALLKRGMPGDLLENMIRRIPRPILIYDVGDKFEQSTCEMLAESIKQMQSAPSAAFTEVMEDDPNRYLNQLTTRDVAVPWKMEFVRDNPNASDDPIVRCPKCKHEGPLMSDFTYLAHGFNGIRKGAPDDLDAQECGNCGAVMEWHHIDQTEGS